MGERRGLKWRRPPSPRSPPMNKEDRKDLVERLREEAFALQQTAWRRLDGGQQCSLNAGLAHEAADELARLRRELEEARKALEPFAAAVEKADASAAAMGFSPSFDAYAPEWSFTFGQLRAARAALRAGEKL
ncbi:p065 [Rhizobium phage 16-3]|uniref:p065 n=1 Tax=Rhizobium phage 16-3 TaxID=10704 RepID=UPI00017BA612|nr:p065 [Rhizobium phage 16-3]ABF71319.1 p065 [Rhizobium phage 16-3]